MVIKSTLASIFTYVYNFFRYCVDTIVYVITIVTSFTLMMLNAVLSFFVLFEEIVVICLILPWIPTKKIGNIFCFLRRWGLPKRLTFTLYAVMLLIVVFFSLLGLELHYLQVNEGLLANFDDFKSSLFSSMKLFIIIHRFLHLLSNEASLRNTCYLLKKRLKIEQAEPPKVPTSLHPYQTVVSRYISAHQYEIDDEPMGIKNYFLCSIVYLVLMNGNISRNSCLRVMLERWEAPSTCGNTPSGGSSFISTSSFIEIENGEELDDKDLGETIDEDLDISNLRGELERTKLDLEAMKEAYIRLQQKMEFKSGQEAYSASY